MAAWHRPRLGAPSPARVLAVDCPRGRSGPLRALRAGPCTTPAQNTDLLRETLRGASPPPPPRRRARGGPAPRMATRMMICAMLKKHQIVPAYEGAILPSRETINHHS